MCSSSSSSPLPIAPHPILCLEQRPVWKGSRDPFRFMKVHRGKRSLRPMFVRPPGWTTDTQTHKTESEWVREREGHVNIYIYIYIPCDSSVPNPRLSLGQIVEQRFTPIATEQQYYTQPVTTQYIEQRAVPVQQMQQVQLVEVDPILLHVAQNL